MSPISTETLPDALRARFPPLSDAVDANVASQGMESVYGLIGTVLWWEYMQPALVQGDTARIKECLMFVDELLSSDDDLIVEAVVVRILPWFNDAPIRDLVRTCAGPVLRRFRTQAFDTAAMWASPASEADN